MATFRKENGSLVRKAGKAIVDLALSLTSNNAIANSVVTQEINAINADLSVFSFRVNNGKAQYSTNNGTTWHNLGGESMPTLDFANPVKTFNASDTYTTSGDDKYLYVAFLLGNNDTARVLIDGTVASSSNRTVNMLSNPIVHLKAGQVVTTSSDWNNVNKVYILKAV